MKNNIKGNASTGNLFNVILAVVFFTSVAGLIYGNITNATLLAGVPTWGQTLFLLIAVFGGIYFLASAFKVPVK